MRRFVLLSFLLILTLVLAACGGAPAQTPVAVEPSPTTAPQPGPTPGPTAPAESPAPTAAPTAESSAAGVSFARDVQPILNSRCISCHGVEDIKDGLDLRTYASLMRGSQGGSVVIAGNAEASSLYTLSAQGKMPKRGPKLTPDQLRVIRDWINQGARDN